MKFKKIIAVVLAATAMSVTTFAAEVPDYDSIYDKALEFAAQYPYKNGDVEKSHSLSSNYTSGIEKRPDGVEYECPAIYRDQDAVFAEDFELKKGEMSLHVNGQRSEYGKTCVLQNSTTLVSVDVFSELGCDISHNEKYFLTVISKNNTILEIIPFIIGMRKNQADGYYVPLNSCARYVDNELYVPLRTVAEELDISVEWDGTTHSVLLND